MGGSGSGFHEAAAMWSQELGWRSISRLTHGTVGIGLGSLDVPASHRSNNQRDKERESKGNASNQDGYLCDFYNLTLAVTHSCLWCVLRLIWTNPSMCGNRLHGGEHPKAEITVSHLELPTGQVTRHVTSNIYLSLSGYNLKTYTQNCQHWVLIL